MAIRRLPAAATLLLLLLSPAVAHPQGADTKVDYVILIDVSGSMVGRPAGSGSVNIFPQVQEALSRFIRELEPGNTVFITPFAETLGATRRFDLEAPPSGRAAEAFVRSLQPTGSATHVYGSMREVFNRYDQFRGDQAERIAVLMVFTDGLDNGPERMNMQEVVRQFGLQRRGDDFIYYATLGVDLPANDVAALVTSGFGTHDPSPAGEVHPVRIIQPRYRLLSFGNLMRDPEAERILRMDVSGQLPPGFALRTRTSFSQLSERGIYVEVQPDQLPVQPETPLTLRLVNAAETPTGDYEGTIEFESPNPQVVVVPKQIRARFTYARPRVARVLPAAGTEQPQMDLGRMDPFRAENRKASVGDSLILDLDREAAARGGSFGLRVRQDAKNPSVLPADALTVNGQSGEAHMLDASARRLDLRISANEAQVLPGTYSGALILEDGSVELEGEREIPWRFEVAKPPLSTGAVVALILTALAVLVAAALFARYWITGGLAAPLLKGRLTVRAPADVYGQEIPIAGQKEVTLGSGTSQLQAAGGRIRIVPERTRKVFRIKVVAEDGSVLIRHQGESHDVPVASESLQDGDQIALPPYRIEYNRF